MSNATIPSTATPRCACGAKYWDFNEVRWYWECASCSTKYDAKDYTDEPAPYVPVPPRYCPWCGSEVERWGHDDNCPTRA